MLAILRNILQCNLNDGLNYFYIESKVKLLLTLVLDQVANIHPLEPLKLTDEDIEKLYQARTLVLSDLEEKLSITKLSRLVLLNEYKLKKGFKYLFGTTIFECRRSVKMEKAKEILLNTNCIIDDIAYTLGYDHPSNFRKAFKRHFNYTPAELKKFQIDKKL